MSDLDEIMGIDEIMGADEIGDEELGAVVRRKLRARASKPPIASRVGAGLGGMYKKRTTLGVPKASFANNAAAGTTTTVEIEPQRDFQPERFLVAAVSPLPSAKVGVKDIRIGDTPQMPSVQAVPLEMFLRDSIGVALDLSLCKAGTKLTITYEVLTLLGAAEGGDIVAGFAGEVYGQ
jgi:hypothetical protein